MALTRHAQTPLIEINTVFSPLNILEMTVIKSAILLDGTRNVSLLLAK